LELSNLYIMNSHAKLINKIEGFVKE
jgi:hypothetical protein